jgi:hypothetical protein
LGEASLEVLRLGSLDFLPLNDFDRSDPVQKAFFPAIGLETFTDVRANM